MRGSGLTLSFTRRVHCGGWGKWAVVLWTISLKEESGLTLGRYCFHRMVPELLSMPKSCKINTWLTTGKANPKTSSILKN